MYKPSVFMQDIAPEEYSYVQGIGEHLSEKHLLQYSHRRIHAFTDNADGVTFRNGNIETDGFGFAPLPFPPSLSGTSSTWTGSRGFGIFQSYNGNATKQQIFTVFSYLNDSYAQTNSIDRWTLALTGSTFSAPTNIASYNPGTSPAPGPISHASLNGVDVLTDGDRFYRFVPNATNAYAPVLVQPSTPTILVTGAGNLNGYYAYCVTLIDAQNNESLPSALVATGNLTNNNQTVAITLSGTGGTDALGDGWTKLRLYRTITGQKFTAQTALFGQALLPQSTINVASTTGFPASGTILIHAQVPILINPNTGLPNTVPGVLNTDFVITYTGITATSFTGCTGGSGTASSGSIVVSQGTTATAVDATQNPKFYYVPGMDVTLTPGTNSYIFSADNNSDQSISTPSSTGTGPFLMSNIVYFAGSLRNLSKTGVPTFISAFQNRLIGSNWNNIGGTAYPARYYWNDLQDNTLVSTGNVTSWGNLNFDDVDSADGFPIIGQMAGLQGRFYIFKQNGTHLLNVTGNPSTPFNRTKIDTEYGFYHFSAAQIGGQAIGRTRDGIATFNGATYNHISLPVNKFLSSCINPQGDSGIFDFSLQRYYLAVCSSQIPNYWTNKGLIYTARNAVIVYDLKTQTWEIHKETNIQYFTKLVDSLGREQIFGVDDSSGICPIINGELFGTSVSVLASIVSSSIQNQLTLTGISLPSSFVGKKIFLIYSANSTFSWVNFSTSITAISGTTITTQDNIPFSNINDKILIMIPNNYGTITSSSATSLVDTNNYFQSQTSSIHAITIDPAGVAADFFTGREYKQTSTTALTPIGGQQSITNLYNYVLINQKSFGGTGSLPTPYYLYLTPAFGELRDDTRKKQFKAIKLLIIGKGILRIRTFINSRSTADQVISYTIPSGVKFNDVLIGLKCSTGNYMRIEFAMLKGSGWFKIDGFGIQSRPMGYYAHGL